MKLHYYTAGILLLLSSSLFAKDSTKSNKKCQSTSVTSYVNAEKAFDYAQACSAIETAISFAKSESFLNKESIVKVSYKPLTSIGYEFPNSYNKSATDYSEFFSDSSSKIQMSSFYSQEVHSKDRAYFGLNVHSSGNFSERQKAMILKALHHSVIVHEAIHSLLSSYLTTRPELKLSYGEIEAIAYIGQLKSISPSLRKMMIDLNQDILDITFGYQDLANQVASGDDQVFGLNSFLKYKNNSIKIQKVLNL